MVTAWSPVPIRTHFHPAFCSVSPVHKTNITMFTLNWCWCISLANHSSSGITLIAEARGYWCVRTIAKALIAGRTMNISSNVTDSSSSKKIVIIVYPNCPCTCCRMYIWYNKRLLYIVSMLLLWLNELRISSYSHSQGYPSCLQTTCASM